MDVTNPGSVTVEDEAYPSPGTVPAPYEYPNFDELVQVDEQLTAALASVPSPSSVFPTPSLVNADLEGAVGALNLGVAATTVPPAPGYDPSAQNLTAGTIGEFTVVGGSAPNVQTNYTEQTNLDLEVVAVLDADTGAAPTVATTRYKLVVTPGDLLSLPVSIQGREVEFAEDTLTAADAEAVRTISGLGNNYVVVPKTDTSDLNVPVLTDPQVGDVLLVDSSRDGSQPILDVGGTPSEVFVDSPVIPPPETGTVTGPFLGTVGTLYSFGVPPLTSGVPAPTSVDVGTANNVTQVSDQSPVRGIPAEVNV